MEILRQYATAANIYFPLITRGAADFNSSPATFASGDVKISKNGGSFSNTTNLPSHIANGIYSLALTTTEMTTGLVTVTLIDQTNPKLWEDQCLLVQTYGNASAGLIFNFADSVRAGLTGLPNTAAGASGGLPLAADASGRVDVVNLGGSATALTNLKQAALTIVPGTAITGTLSSTQATTNLTETTDDHYKGRSIIFVTGALLGQTSSITAYNGTSKLLTYNTLPTGESPSNGDTFVIV